MIDIDPGVKCYGSDLFAKQGLRQLPCESMFADAARTDKQIGAPQTIALKAPTKPSTLAGAYHPDNTCPRHSSRASQLRVFDTDSAMDCVAS